EALEFDRVIPGHGSIQEGKAVLAQFRGYVEEITEKVTRGVERGFTLDELTQRITPLNLASLNTNDTRRRVEREFGSLFMGYETPEQMVDGSVKTNVREVFTYLTERKGKREMPLS